MSTQNQSVTENNRLNQSLYYTSERGCEQMFSVSGVCGEDFQKDAFNVKSVSKLCKMKFALSGVCRLRKDVVNGYSV